MNTSTRLKLSSQLQPRSSHRSVSMKRDNPWASDIYTGACSAAESSPGSGVSHRHFPCSAPQVLTLSSAPCLGHSPRGSGENISREITLQDVHQSSGSNDRLLRCCLLVLLASLATVPWITHSRIDAQEQSTVKSWLQWPLLLVPPCKYIFFFLFSKFLCVLPPGSRSSRHLPRIRLAGLLKVSHWIREAATEQPCRGVLGRRAAVGRWHPGSDGAWRKERARGKDAPAPDSCSLKALKALSPGVFSRGVQYTYLDAQGFPIPREGYGTSLLKMSICIVRECTGVACTSLVIIVATEHLEILFYVSERII